MIKMLANYTKPFIWVFTLLATIALSLAVLPFAIKEIAISQLEKQGFDVSIKNIDLNIFTGEFTLNELKERSTKTNNLSLKKLYIKIDPISLFSQKVMISQFKLNGLNVRINKTEDYLTVSNVRFLLKSNSPIKGVNPKTPNLWSVSIINSSIINSHIHYTDPFVDLPVSLKKISLSGLDTKKINSLISLNLNAKINQSKINLKARGDLLNTVAKISSSITLSNLPLTLFKNLSPKGIKINKGLININSDLNLKLVDHNPKLINHKGTFKLANLNIDLEQLDKNFNLTANSLDIINSTTLNPKNIRESLKLESNILFDQILLSTQTKESLSFKNLDVKQVKLSGLDNLNISHVFLSDFKVQKGNKPKPLFVNQSLIINDIRFKNFNHLFIKKVALKNQESDIFVDKNKQNNIQQFLSKFIPETDNAKNNNNKTSEKGFKFKIQEITLSGYSLVKYRDESLSPVFSKELLINTLNIENINNNNSEEITKYFIKGKIDANAPYAISGSIKPFSEYLTLNSKITAEGVGLTDYSSFILPVTGYKIESGEVDTDISIKIKKNQLLGENKLVLHHLNVIEANKKTAKKLNGTLGIPMNKALSLLRDDNNTITLNVPVSGDINNLSLNPKDTINQALGNALKSGSDLYIATALFPYGTIYSLAKFADEKANEIKLQPVTFSMGENNLQIKQKDYLSKVAGILTKKKLFKIKLCGKATIDDKTFLYKKIKDYGELNTKLLALAKQRTLSIENYLTKNHQLSPNRLIDCLESINATGKPRVELLL